MANKGPKPEEIVTRLRQIEVLTGQGMPHLDAIRQIGVTEQTFHRWSAGGTEKRPVESFPAKQVRRDGRGPSKGSQAPSELEPVQQAISGIVCQAEQRAIARGRF